MSNKHVNGDDPYRMTVSEAAKEIDGWVNNGGQIRVDAPHQGNNEVHAHLYLDNDPNTDLLIQIEPDPDPDPDPDDNHDSDDDDYGYGSDDDD